MQAMLSTVKNNLLIPAIRNVQSLISEIKSCAIVEKIDVGEMDLRTEILRAIESNNISLLSHLHDEFCAHCNINVENDRDCKKYHETFHRSGASIYFNYSMFCGCIFEPLAFMHLLTEDIRMSILPNEEDDELYSRNRDFLSAALDAAAYGCLEYIKRHCTKYQGAFAVNDNNARFRSRINAYFDSIVNNLYNQNVSMNAAELANLQLYYSISLANLVDEDRNEKFLRLCNNIAAYHC